MFEAAVTAKAELRGTTGELLRSFGIRLRTNICYLPHPEAIETYKDEFSA